MWRRRESGVSPAPARRLVGGLAVVGLVATLGLVGAAPASAAPITANVQLSLTGLADSENPVGGSVIGIRPGDSVAISTAAVPTAGLDKLKLGTLVSGLLGGVVSIQSLADFSKLPGGKVDTAVKTKPAVTFTFPKAGTYNFTWSMKKLTLLGLLPLDLNGNQLAAAGVKLNAENEYVGQIVVSNNPPKGGLSIQLPKVSVEPSLPVVGKLPKITVPGVTTPKITLPSVPNLAPNLPGGTTPTTPSSSAPSSDSLEYQLSGPSIPEQVVPGGDGGGSGSGSGGILASGDGGFAGILPKLGDSLGAKKASTSGSGTTDADNVATTSNNKTVELAADAGKPSSQLPVILAILAIIALALVAGTYARLFLLKPKS